MHIKELIKIGEITLNPPVVSRVPGRPLSFFTRHYTPSSKTYLHLTPIHYNSIKNLTENIALNKNLIKVTKLPSSSSQPFLLSVFPFFSIPQPLIDIYVERRNKFHQIKHAQKNAYRCKKEAKMSKGQRQARTWPNLETQSSITLGSIGYK